MNVVRWMLSGSLLCLVMAGCTDTASDPAANDAAVDGGADPAMLSTNAAKKSWTPGGADPCKIDTGFPGDEYCIKPPDPKIGFQLHYGPSNYDDPAEVAKYVLMPGEEVTDCVFGETPNETEVFHNEYHGRMRPGSHHLLVYTEDPVAGAAPDGPGPCQQGTTSRNIFGAQTPEIDLVSGSTGAPEDQGLAQRLAPKQRAVLQLHFINSTDKPILREAWTNVIYIDKSKVKVQADPIFFLAGVIARIRPGMTHVSKGKAVAGSNLRLISATGHFHAHTVRFSAWKTVGGVRELLFEDYNWHEPTMFPFNTVYKNAKLDSENKVTGASSGLVELQKGDQIDWECEVVNDSEYTLGFGNEVFKAEMCNMFGAYSPGVGKPWSSNNP